MMVVDEKQLRLQVRSCVAYCLARWRITADEAGLYMYLYRYCQDIDLTRIIKKLQKLFKVYTINSQLQTPNNIMLPLIPVDLVMYTRTKSCLVECETRYTTGIYTCLVFS